MSCRARKCKRILHTKRNRANGNKVDPEAAGSRWAPIFFGGICSQLITKFIYIFAFFLLRITSVHCSQSLVSGRGRELEFRDRVVCFLHALCIADNEIMRHVTWMQIGKMNVSDSVFFFSLHYNNASLVSFHLHGADCMQIKMLLHRSHVIEVINPLNCYPILCCLHIEMSIAITRFPISSIRVLVSLHKNIRQG